MTLAEQIRNQIDVEKDLPWLREDVLQDIKVNGRWRVICDNHIQEIREGWSLPNKYFTPVSEWANKEGLRAHATYNGYGVRSLELTL